MTSYVKEITPDTVHTLRTDNNRNRIVVHTVQFSLGDTTGEDDTMKLFGSLDNVTYHLLDTFTADEFVSTLPEVPYVFAVEGTYSGSNQSTKAQLVAADNYAGGSKLLFYVEE